jgi:hypothetical protein
MAKKELYFADAERLYVNEQCTVAEISSRLRLGEKTIRNWKEQGKWDVKRKGYLDSRRAFHEELYEFARHLMKSIMADMTAGIKIDPGRMYAFTKVLPNILKVKDYEDVVAAHELEGKEKGASNEEIVQTIQQALGIIPAPIQDK